MNDADNQKELQLESEREGAAVAVAINLITWGGSVGSVRIRDGEWLAIVLASRAAFLSCERFGDHLGLASWQIHGSSIDTRTYAWY